MSVLPLKTLIPASDVHSVEHIVFEIAVTAFHCKDYLVVESEK